MYDGETYVLSAEIYDLPLPEGTDFYEGWLVKKGTSEFISTGRAYDMMPMYSNVFRSNEDLKDKYDFYVLTLEPDDGDPAPAEHIVEGDIKEK
jgi:hypothetical protein